MPLYEYTCGTCLNRFEKLRSFSQMDDPTPCPDCGSESRRQLSVFMSFSTDASGQTTPAAEAGAVVVEGPAARVR
jgi:putative FmdB family regulatory protein